MLIAKNYGQSLLSVDIRRISLVEAHGRVSLKLKTENYCGNFLRFSGFRVLSF